MHTSCVLSTNTRTRENIYTYIYRTHSHTHTERCIPTLDSLHADCFAILRFPSSVDAKLGSCLRCPLAQPQTERTDCIGCDCRGVKWNRLHEQEQQQEEEDVVGGHAMLSCHAWVLSAVCQSLKGYEQVEFFHFVAA